MINVTKTFLLPQKEYEAQLKRIWQNECLTNRGEPVLEPEAKLKKRFRLQHLLLTNNSTIPLQIALHSLGEKGEIITTPFSYVATTSAIVWEGFTPDFVDIPPEYLTIYFFPNKKKIIKSHGNRILLHYLKKTLMFKFNYLLSILHDRNIMVKFIRN